MRLLGDIGANGQLSKLGAIERHFFQTAVQNPKCESKSDFVSALVGWKISGGGFVTITSPLGVVITGNFIRNEFHIGRKRLSI